MGVLNQLDDPIDSGQPYNLADVVVMASSRETGQQRWPASEKTGNNNNWHVRRVATTMASK